MDLRKQRTPRAKASGRASIIIVLVPGCAAQATAMTASDLAFLRGLYKMRPESNLRGQKDFISYEMRTDLGGR